MNDLVANDRALNDLVLAPTTIPDAAPLEYVEAAAAAGYRHVGLRLNRSPGLPFQPVVGNATLVKEMKGVLSGADLRVLDIYSFYLEPDTDVAAFTPVIELAAEFGAHYLVTMGADTDWSRQRDNFVRICEIAAGFRLVCILEPAVIRPLASLAQAERLVRESGCSNAAICVDPLNFSRAGDRAVDLRRVDAGLFPYAQITDGIIGPDEPNPALLGRMGPNKRCLLGEGMVPLDDILDALPRGLPLSIELPPTDRAIGAAQWARLVLEDAQRYLGRYYAGKVR
jgi:sugar phosphate isomerase/epimerase